MSAMTLANAGLSGRPIYRFNPWQVGGTAIESGLPSIIKRQRQLRRVDMKAFGSHRAVVISPLIRRHHARPDTSQLSSTSRLTVRAPSIPHADQ